MIANEQKQLNKYLKDARYFAALAREHRGRDDRLSRRCHQLALLSLTMMQIQIWRMS